MLSPYKVAKRIDSMSLELIIGIAGLAAILLAFPSIGRAQVLYGSITGNVTDSSGAIVPGAKVEVRDVSRNVTQLTTTDSSGLYRLSELLPGTYKVTISAPSFSSSVVSNVIVQVNAVRRVDAQLQIGQVSQNVTVTGEAPELQTDRADVRTELDQKVIDSLPSISSEGKSFQSLYKLLPGASLPAENNSPAGNPQRAMTTNINGQSNQGNNTRIDGVQDSYPWLPQNIAYVPPSDSIQAVSVVTNSFDAEQGGAGGAAINVQIKSGTNQFHGDLHELHTDNALWAQNYFNSPDFRKPLNVFNQFGGAVGGPIKKDKLFFFGDWESTRQAQAPSGNFQTVPTGGLTSQSAQANGFFDFRGITDASGNPVNIYDPRTGNSNGTNRQVISCNGVQNEICLADVDPAAMQMAALIPTANVAGATSNNFFVQQTGFFHRDDFDGKINYIPNQNSTIFGRYSFSRSNIFDPPALGDAGGNATLGGQNGNAFSRIQVVGLGGTYAFTPNLLLDVNGGYTRQRIDAQDTDIGQPFGLNTLKIPGTNDPTNQLYWGIPAFQFNTFSNLGNANTGNPFLFRDNQYVSNANLSWSRGKHQIRFGIEYDHTQLNHFQPQGGSFQTARGSFRFTGAGTELSTCNPVTGQCSAAAPTNAQFNSFADFLLGLPDELGKAVQNADTIALRWSQWAWYARDQWQITPKLTFTYGLRWEYYPFAYSDFGGARVLDPSTMNVLVGGGNSGIPTDDGVDIHAGLFLPRLGVAYRPFAKTVIRAGYGMSADSNNWRFLRNSYPADTISDFTGNFFPQAAGSAFAPAGSLTGLNAIGPYSYLPAGITLIPVVPNAPGSFPLPNGVGTTTIPQDFRRGYINSYNLTIENEFGGFVSDIGYVGQRGIRPLTNMNINPAEPGTGQAGRLLNAQFAGNWNDINQLTPFGNNYYDALQAKLTRRFGSTQLGFVYTFSKAIDYEDNEEINFILFPLPQDLARNRAPASFDRTNNFEAYGIWDLPFGGGKRWANNGMAAKLAGGWELNWVLSAMSGTPFTITDTGTGATALNAPGSTQTVNIVSPINIVNGQPRSSCAPGNMSCEYFDPASFAQVSAPGVFGDAGRNILRGPGLFNLDMSVRRNFKLTERFTFQFEADAFGVTNTPHFNNPNTNIAAANFGAITSTLVTTNAGLGGSGGQRQWWFGGKLLF